MHEGDPLSKRSLRQKMQGSLHRFYMISTVHTKVHPASVARHLHQLVTK